MRGGRTTDNEHKLKQERLILAVTRHFFPYEDSQEVEQLPRVAVQSLSLEVFKIQLDKALSNPI